MLRLSHPRQRKVPAGSWKNNKTNLFLQLKTNVCYWNEREEKYKMNTMKPCLVHMLSNRLNKVYKNKISEEYFFKFICDKTNLKYIHPLFSIYVQKTSINPGVRDLNDAELLEIPDNGLNLAWSANVHTSVVPWHNFPHWSQHNLLECELYLLQ